MFRIGRSVKLMISLVMIAFFMGCILAGPVMAARQGSSSDTTSTGDTAGQYVDDSAITAKVKAAIFNEPTLKSMDISVKTEKGVVLLSGFVNFKDQIKKAEEMAKSVAGVKAVKNGLKVKKK